MKNLGQTLKLLRKENNLSIKDIIKKLAETNIHIKDKTVYKWENNDSVPDVKTINVLSNIYGITLTSLYEDSKFCKTLNKHESIFIKNFRNNLRFRKIVKLLININTED